MNQGNGIYQEIRKMTRKNTTRGQSALKKSWRKREFGGYTILLVYTISVVNTCRQSEPQSNHRVQKRAAATTVKERLWDFGIVPYEIDESWGSYRKALARQAMRHWENHTCLRFVERNQTEHADYVFFTERPCGCVCGTFIGKEAVLTRINCRCCSFVGKRGIGAQALSIGENCAKFGIIVHEIGHAIGYYHEHTRPDRDKYVQVFEENIMDGRLTSKFVNLNRCKVALNSQKPKSLKVQYSKYSFFAAFNRKNKLFFTNITK